MNALDRVQEGTFQVSFNILLGALQYVIRAVALVPFKHFLEVAHNGLGHDAHPLGSIGSICHHPSIVKLPSILVNQLLSLTELSSALLPFVRTTVSLQKLPDVLEMMSFSRMVLYVS